MGSVRYGFGALVAFGLIVSGPAPAQEAVAPNGVAAYRQNCAMCHALDLHGMIGPGLTGPIFAKRWHGKEKALFDIIRGQMPPASPARCLRTPIMPSPTTC